ncbi:PfkB family carbohydrate kinase [Maledivibacter halophilus]|uniref:Fructoselysine 6-kinase n=1 Tax=Maledivibacter halophilus TaxID=36842 RepID=A0A1T5LJV0_9FIRM|nr:PfkB family carbohydrate kinase [Maledivibacter halophilus]SKC76252.1 fructoselysine 6-kinase [Maledivibacter halophilus]
MKIISIGDNVTDCYLDKKVYYPGGNCVNVAVNCKRYGASESAYIGIFGNDEKADHIIWALDQEGIAYKYSRFMMGISGQPRVNLTPEGDRVFVGGPKNTVQHIVRLRLTQEDLQYISKFDLCHTSCYSSIETELPKIKKRCNISFDFSENRERKYLSKVCPHIKFAFFSGADLSIDDIKYLIKTCHLLGTEIVGITRGSKRVLFSKEGNLFEQPIKPTKVVDTMGAGDSFIAGFLTYYSENKNMREALNFAVICAAKTCSIDGAFGYPHELKEEFI